ncbi:hypothetical protein PsorP6_006158 [Peronosclerospora sorghi]|uniref:Uncharacterized protein n=1 Tax=Peronosclerospora sorghi TaxID=230839 RepID=A0ACC0W4M4_9STRA|nr:hypothetical protein PsorP6_006158 [Peronosclerospora sorghi]
MRFCQVGVLFVAILFMETKACASEILENERAKSVLSNAFSHSEDQRPSLDGVVNLRSSATVTKSKSSAKRLAPIDIVPWNLLKLQYWLWRGTNPSVVYRHFGLNKVKGGARKSKFFKYYAKYLDRWVKRQAV